MFKRTSNFQNCSLFIIILRKILFLILQKRKPNLREYTGNNQTNGGLENSSMSNSGDSCQVKMPL